MASGSDRARGRRHGRRLALASIFEADFGQRTATAVLERHLAETDRDPTAAELARELVAAVQEHRVEIDELIGRTSLTASQVLATLSVLEMRRLVRRLPGHQFVRA